jgi:protein-tyrosine phosphatase
MNASTEQPIELNALPATLWEVSGPWSGRLAIVPRPRGGDWLEDEIQALRSAGVDVVVSLLTRNEATELALDDEAALSQAHEVEYVSLPIEDRAVPASLPAMPDLVHRIRGWLDDGKTVVAHCRSGIGRSTVLAASVLVSAGVSPDAAFEQIERARGCPVPDTDGQRAWVGRFARDTAAVARKAS